VSRFHWIEEASRLHSIGEPFALVSVLHCTPPASAKAGDKAIITADGRIRGWIGGGCAQPAVIKTVRQCLRDGQPRRIRIAPRNGLETPALDEVLEFGMICHSGGVLELFVDPALPAEKLLVIGDSPVARALVELAPRLGFTLNLMAHGALPKDYPDAARVLSSDQPSASVLEEFRGSYIVVATQGRRELQGLGAALAFEARGIWFVASRRKAAVLKDQLCAAGANPQRVAAIVAPAGEPIGAKTPEEIALAVLASVVASRRAADSAGVARLQDCRSAGEAVEPVPPYAAGLAGLLRGK
jgi:xanthine dehydrogenase accessory factor